MWAERQALFWIAALAVMILVVAFLRDVLLPFAVGAALAYFLNPIADTIERIGLGRTFASLLVIGVVAIGITTALFFLLPLAISQLRQLALTLPSDLDRMRQWAETYAEQHLGQSFPTLKSGLERAFGELAQGSSGIFAAAAQALWSRSLALFNLISLIIVTPVVAFYLLRDWPKMLARIDDWLPREHAPTIRHLLAAVDDSVGAFVRGQGTICLVLGAIYAVALSAIGLRYGLLIGLGTGLLAFVPMVGWALGLVVALVVALTQTWPETTLTLQVLAIYGVAMAIDSGVLSPLIVGQKVGLHPVWLMLALFVFSALFGLLGALIAVPVAAALAVIVRFARDRYLASPIYLGNRPSAEAVSAPRRES